MMRDNTAVLSLDAAVQVLVSYDRDGFRQPNKTVAQLFAAGIALLYHLKSDQRRLYQIRQEQGKEATLPPSGLSTPAIDAILHNGPLFRVLLRWLQSQWQSSNQDADASMSAMDRNNGSIITMMMSSSASANHSRKRSLSNVGDPFDPRHPKTIKLASHSSPVPNNTNTAPAARFKMAMPPPSQSGRVQLPPFSLPTLSAVILYAGMMHLDHWPAQFLQAYAEDSFGTRSWVDDVRCQVLVENLKLAHDVAAQQEQQQQQQKLEETAMTEDDAHLLVEADQVARAYQVWEQGRNVETVPSSQQQHQQQQQPLEDAFKDDDDGSGNGSSSGEEEDEIVVPSPSAALKLDNNDQKAQKKLVKERLGEKSIEETDCENVASARLYSIRQRRLNLTRTRPRYFGTNGDQATEMVVTCLSDRLEQKSKQNSGLLQALPSFCSFPAVRTLVAAQLEKWLQSPALAGLARTLFAAVVGHMNQINPPLESDLEVVKAVVSMRLKANLLNAHIENLSSLARRLPQTSVANIMYSDLLSQILEEGISPAITSNVLSGQLRMIGAIHRVLPPEVSYDAMAAALLVMLVKSPLLITSQNERGRDERCRFVAKLRRLIRSVASSLGVSFNCSALLDGLLSFDVSCRAWTRRDEEDKARLMMQCVSLYIDSVMRDDETFDSGFLEGPATKKLRASLLKIRKRLLLWCCVDYSNICGAGLVRRNNLASEKELVGAALPDFHSILDGRCDDTIPNWLNVMRCVLFLEDPRSPLMKHFLMPADLSDTDEADLSNEKERLLICHEHGADVDDEHIHIIIRAISIRKACLTTSVALELLENLLSACSCDRKGKVLVTDPMSVWDLYQLARYKYPTPRLPDDDVADHPAEILKDVRLAYPGLWWRVTMSALILCGCAPSSIGLVMWKNHPTLNALVKMITSMRYRFPTVDCDELERIALKEKEQTSRDTETRYAEKMFLPKRTKKTEADKTTGSRVSRRLLKQQQEKEASAHMVELNSRRQLLRTAQKSIMLWAPDGPARKPPRESTNLLLTIEASFNLSEKFQRSMDPDFVLLTIGQTSRGAIERAYEWLIPVVSRFPDTISRLPSSASCFLLLKAYGTEHGGSSELKELSSPLLKHVQDSLDGNYGESDAVRAFDLLMSDVACPNPDRRRCARRVFQDALSGHEPRATRVSWQLKILNLKYAKSMVENAIQCMSSAAFFERGRVLRSLILALCEHTKFAVKNDLSMVTPFSNRLVEIIAFRPSVCAEALTNFADLRALTVRTLHGSFFYQLKEATPIDHRAAVSIKVAKNAEKEMGTLITSLQLLQSLCVLLSIREHDACAPNMTKEDDVDAMVEHLTDALLSPDTADSFSPDSDMAIGLASARQIGVEDPVVTVDFWNMLILSDSKSIAKRASLSAPLKFLPRMILCSGLSRTSFVTMISRLGRFAEFVESKDVALHALLAPSTSVEWDIGRIGQRSDIIGRIRGRVAAYMRLFDTTAEDYCSSRVFVDWLTTVSISKNRKGKKLVRAKATGYFSNLSRTQMLIDDLWKDPNCERAAIDDIILCEVQLPSFVEVRRVESVDRRHGREDGDDGDDAVDLIMRCATENRDEKVDSILTFQDESFESEDRSVFFQQRLAAAMLGNFFTKMNAGSERFKRFLIRRIPEIFDGVDNCKLWATIYSGDEDSWHSVTLDDVAHMCPWNTSQMIRCVEWMLNIAESSKLNAYRMSNSILLWYGRLPTATVKSAEFIDGVARIALASLRRADEETECRSLTCALNLLLQAASGGNTSVQTVAKAIVESSTIADGTCDGRIHQAALLRLYLSYPFQMDLTTPAVRSFLLDAAQFFADSWHGWSCSLDHELGNVLDALRNGDLRLSKSVADLTRKHPLLLLRKSGALALILYNDATVTSSRSNDEMRGYIVGESLAGPRTAAIRGRDVSVTVRHWGFVYWEPLWMSILDMMSAIPREVLFASGPRLGLNKVVGLYLQLLLVQLQLRTADKAVRLKAKLADFGVAFKDANEEGWKVWLGSNVDGTEVRHLLISCDLISAREAIGSLTNSSHNGLTNH